MSNAIELVNKARAEAFATKAEIEQRIEQVKLRINQVCRSGILPFEEAFPAWLAAFERYADEGAQRLETTLAGYAKPNEPHPITGNTSSLRSDASYPFRSDSRGDPGCVFAHVNRKAITEHARAWFESTCADADVPNAHERRAELERLAEEQRKLESERDDLTDRLAELLGTEPSERTQKRRLRVERERELDAFNRPIDQWNERNARKPADRASDVRVSVSEDGQ